MQTLKNDGKNYLLLDAGEVKAHDKRAAAIAALEKGTIVNTADMSLHLEAGSVYLTVGGKKHQLARTPAEVLESIASYGRSDQVLADLASATPPAPKTEG